jgi:hypothetical protein
LCGFAYGPSAALRLPSSLRRSAAAPHSSDCPRLAYGAICCATKQQTKAPCSSMRGDTSIVLQVVAEPESCSSAGSR